MQLIAKGRSVAPDHLQPLGEPAAGLEPRRAGRTGAAPSRRNDLELHAWRVLLRSHARILRALDAELTARTALSIRGYEVLVRLASAPDSSLRMSELAASVLLSPSGITRLVDQLEERRLVRRRQDAADARAFFAELTPEGRSAFEKARRVYSRSVREHFGSRLTSAQLRNVAEALEVFLPERQQPDAQ